MLRGAMIIGCAAVAFLASTVSAAKPLKPGDKIQTNSGLTHKVARVKRNKSYDWAVEVGSREVIPFSEIIKVQRRMDGCYGENDYLSWEVVTPEKLKSWEESKREQMHQQNLKFALDKTRFSKTKAAAETTIPAGKAPIPSNVRKAPIPSGKASIPSGKAPKTQEEREREADRNEKRIKLKCKNKLLEKQITFALKTNPCLMPWTLTKLRGTTSRPLIFSYDPLGNFDEDAPFTVPSNEQITTDPEKHCWAFTSSRSTKRGEFFTRNFERAVRTHNLFYEQAKEAREQGYIPQLIRGSIQRSYWSLVGNRKTITVSDRTKLVVIGYQDSKYLVRMVRYHDPDTLVATAEPTAKKPLETDSKDSNTETKEPKSDYKFPIGSTVKLRYDSRRVSIDHNVISSATPINRYGRVAVETVLRIPESFLEKRDMNKNEVFRKESNAKGYLDPVKFDHCEF